MHHKKSYTFTSYSISHPSRGNSSSHSSLYLTRAALSFTMSPSHKCSAHRSSIRRRSICTTRSVALFSRSDADSAMFCICSACVNPSNTVAKLSKRKLSSSACTRVCGAGFVSIARARIVLLGIIEFSFHVLTTQNEHDRNRRITIFKIYFLNSLQQRCGYLQTTTIKLRRTHIHCLVRNGLQSTQEHPQRQNVVVKRERAHSHHELHLRVLRLVDTHCLDLHCCTL